MIISSSPKRLLLFASLTGCFLAGLSTRSVAATDSRSVASQGAAPNALFRVAGATTGKPLQAQSAQYYAERAAGRKPAGRVTALDRASFSALGAAKAGDAVSLPLTQTEFVTGAVKLARQANGATQVSGVLSEDARNSFFLISKGGKVSGMILLKSKGLAYRVEQDAKGAATLREVALSEVLCEGIPLSPVTASMAGAIPAADAAPQAITVPVLNSRPDLQPVIYLDFDGETVTDPAWDNGNTIVAPPFNLSVDQITQIFNRVKEDYYPFGVNVTTDVARYQAAAVGRRMRVIITPNDAAGRGAGGIAYLTSFYTAGTFFTNDIPCWVFNSDVVGISEAISHECGHTFGLSHDGREIPGTGPGTGHEEYYLGQGNGPTSWCPIMGAAYYKNISQWSKGEYQYANNQEDDVAIISDLTKAGIGYVPDEAGDTLDTAAFLTYPGGVVGQSGVVTQATDLDFFSFGTKGGTVTFTATGATPKPNLDIGLEIQDKDGTILATAEPANDQTATITMDLKRGSYNIVVLGTGDNDPLTTGYTNYGSIGAYRLDGIVPPVGGSERAPDLASFQPPNWSNKIVVNRTPGSTVDSGAIYASDTVYVDFAIGNIGSAPTGLASSAELLLDGASVGIYPIPKLDSNAYGSARDISLGKLGVGAHTLQVLTDRYRDVAEVDETNNSFIRSFNVGQTGTPNLTFTQPTGFSDNVVISKSPTVTMDSAYISASDPVYVSFAAKNNGSAPAPASVTQLFVDDVLKNTFPTPALNVDESSVTRSYALGKLLAGTHAIRLQVDGANTVPEGNEQDNQYVKTVVIHSPDVDFDLDGNNDVVWQNLRQGDRVIWYLKSGQLDSQSFLATIPPEWQIAGAGDFNGDGYADVIWQNIRTGDRLFWYLQNGQLVSQSYLALIPPEWQIAGVGDFNGDGMADIIWQNNRDGERIIWFLSNGNVIGQKFVATIPPEWQIAAAADFNSDGKADIVWQNTRTGDRIIWYLNDGTLQSQSFLATIPPEWQIVAGTDFNGDGFGDVAWQNTRTGERIIWYLRNGIIVSQSFLTNVPPEWNIADH